MRILHILNDVTDRGNGIVNTAVDLAVEQVRHGHKVAVVSGGGGYQSLLECTGVRHYTLDQSRSPLRIVHAGVRLRGYLREFQPDVVHAHMRTGLLLAWFWSRLMRLPLVGHVHNVHDRESIVMGLADRAIAVSHSVADTMAASGIAREKLRVVLNRILGNQRQPCLDQVEPARLQRPAIVTVGGMTMRKGIQELIAAFEKVGRDYPACHLYLVGDGVDRKRFEELARQSVHCARIHFEGFTSVPEAYMLSADIFVLASRRESFGLVLTEARAAGCAILATDIDGIAEALDGGRAGLLIPPGDIDALERALCRLLGCEQDRAFWKARSLQGIEMYSIHRMAQEVDEVYDELLQSKNRSEFSREASLS